MLSPAEVMHSTRGDVGSRVTGMWGAGRWCQAMWGSGRDTLGHRGMWNRGGGGRGAPGTRALGGCRSRGLRARGARGARRVRWRCGPRAPLPRRGAAKEEEEEEGLPSTGRVKAPCNRSTGLRGPAARGFGQRRAAVRPRWTARPALQVSAGPGGPEGPGRGRGTSSWGGFVVRGGGGGQ